VLELNVKSLKHLVPSATYPSFSKAAVIADSYLFVHATSTVIGASEANARLDEGADVALMWIHPYFHFSHPRKAKIQSLLLRPNNQLFNLAPQKTLFLKMSSDKSWIISEMYFLMFLLVCLLTEELATPFRMSLAQSLLSDPSTDSVQRS